ERPLPLSAAQRRLWFLYDLDPDGAEYNTGVALRLRGTLDLGALRRALGRLAARHDSLRTVFAEVDGQVTQKVLPEVALPLRVADLPPAPAGPRDEETERLLAEELRRPFDLTAGPPARALLARRAEDDHVLLLAQHHIVTDGWSVGVLVRELTALYRAEASGEPDALPEPGLQYPDFAAWEHGRG
ncbi:condensation domain-containing protein, partial [Streptomyces sp. CO7]